MARDKPPARLKPPVVGLEVPIAQSAPDPLLPASSLGVYGIPVAAQLTGCGIQTLRLYEQRGLLRPERTPAGTRRYSLDDLHRVRRITGLLDSGLNLAGAAEVLSLEAENAVLRAEIAQLRTVGESARPPSRPRRRPADPRT